MSNRCRRPSHVASLSGSRDASPASGRDVEWTVDRGKAKGLSVTADSSVLVAVAGKCQLKQLALQYLDETLGRASTSASSGAVYRRTAVCSQELQNFVRRRLGRHDEDYTCTCLVFQVHARTLLLGRPERHFIIIIIIIIIIYLHKNCSMTTEQ